MSDAKGYLLIKALAVMAIFAMTMPYVARQKARDARQRQTDVLTAQRDLLERAVDLYLQENRHDIARRFADENADKDALDVAEDSLRPYLPDFLFEGDRLRRPKAVKAYRLRIVAKCVESATPDGRKCDFADKSGVCRCVFYEMAPSAEIETELQPLDF